jgi:uncharacterized membrane protein
MTNDPVPKKLQIFVGVTTLVLLILAGLFFILVLPFLLSWALKRFFGVDVSALVFILLNVVVAIIAGQVLKRLSESKNAEGV